MSSNADSSNLSTTTIGVSELTPYYRNPRRGNITLIAESLQHLGQYRPIVVNKGSQTGRPNEVLAGNHTLAAARELGWETIDIVTVDIDDHTAARIVAVDNRTSDVALNDDEILAALLNDLPDLTATGYTDADLAALLATTTEPAALVDPDETPPAPIDPVTKPGDVWHLGPHRLLCGDATDMAAVEAMLDGDRCDCMWTDPPYGVEIVGGSHAIPASVRRAQGKLTIQNDGAAELPELLAGAFAVATAALVPGAPVYIAHPDTQRLTFETAMRDAGWLFRQNLMWAKDTLVLGRSDYHYRHEPILYGFTASSDDRGRLGRGGKHWYGDNAQTTVFTVPRPARNAEHPTMKPVDLITPMLSNSCPPGGLVYEPFGGSGSTLVAAHLTNRTARVVELDPKYADVICLRWQKLTGEAPRLKGGDAHTFTQG